MTVLQALVLGVLQGITEFIPVSSSGHLILARTLMGIDGIPELFDVFLHIATLVVVVYTFRRDVARILVALGRAITRRRREKDGPPLRLAGLLAAASVITAVVGFGISTWEGREEPRLVAAWLIVTAAVLIASAFFRGGRGIQEIGWGRALLLGFAQGLGVFPGISRSGITIGTGLICGLDRPSAGTFSFLLSIPAITGAFVLTLKDAATLSENVPTLSLAFGFLAALISGYAALKILLWLIRRGKLWVFSLYLIPAGVVGLILL